MHGDHGLVHDIAHVRRRHHVLDRMMQSLWKELELRFQRHESPVELVHQIVFNQALQPVREAPDLLFYVLQSRVDVPERLVVPVRTAAAVVVAKLAADAAHCQRDAVGKAAALRFQCFQRPVHHRQRFFGPSQHRRMVPLWVQGMHVQRRRLVVHQSTLQLTQQRIHALRQDLDLRLEGVQPTMYRRRDLVRERLGLRFQRRQTLVDIPEGVLHVVHIAHGRVV
ncbi:hypothetical protein H257_02868 [Aphanomyces astaci]|uniref:Uncharacterized protein n=1 Tax=Aphanomyces astaci TaxID=112090 RepID=W4GZ10_APHAT|nr:hypothetical protein H257_02868 [Aphanomyces astaci]ETV84975.1 hypothetical protein H257_02868 [Aphanomyces astaci]|eukprot:XP_009824993.1 hypothetical protein H257_02868 [Aphanomyces astaci]